MATAAINPAARVLGWNIELLHQFHGTPFAGIFQPAKGDLTFRDIVEELRLCFEFPQESSGVWDSIAFGLLKTFNYSPDDANPAPKIVHGRDGLDQPVPALPKLRREALKDRAVIQYLVFKHKACNLPANSSLNKHFKETCAEHLSDYVRRQDPRYLPPKKASANRRYAAYPFRKTLRGRSSASTSPSKRSASGSVSPRKDADIDQADDDFAGIVVPPNCEIPDHILKRTMANFRAILLQSADSCVVTGMGRSWILNPTIGPALQVCHIVSPLHYHTYPLPSNNVDGTQDTSEDRQPDDIAVAE
ncbi:hypothetical protein CCM_09098 [Cordyceps militaris CM01]|uniref:Uncharacterized protein n=1 Tax=Cordyceps militaris (strain CM01) TaxID=983644 RepID=G3JTF8_CORMM|nr:uncharacterized protein CCM_09098 [Cordyceps militaris CM01]EGX87962.1 hypothetical protein CCM_09098 [Cordyceps militaris CM01]